MTHDAIINLDTGTTEVSRSLDWNVTVDTEMPSVNVGIPGQRGPIGPTGPAGPEGPEGPAGQDGEDGAATAGSGVLLLASGAAVPGGTPVDTIIYRKSPPPTTWSFTGGSLPSGWSAQGTPTSVSFDGTGMTATYDQGDAHKVAMPTTGVDCTVTARFVSGGHVSIMMGVMLVDASGNGVASVYYHNPAGNLASRVTTWAYGSVFDEEAVATTFPAWLKLRHSPISTLPGYASRSLDGTTFSNETAPITPPGGAGAPGVIGIGSILGTVTAKVSSVSFSGGVGGLQGYWNGSAVVPF